MDEKDEEKVFGRRGGLARTPQKQQQQQNPEEAIEIASSPLGPPQAPESGPGSSGMSQSMGSASDGCETYVDASTGAAGGNGRNQLRSSTPLEARTEPPQTSNCRNPPGYKRKRAEKNAKRLREELESSSEEHSFCVFNIGGGDGQPAEKLPDLYEEMHKVLKKIRILQVMMEVNTDHTRGEFIKAVEALHRIAVGYCDKADKLREKKATATDAGCQTTQRMVDAGTQVELSSLLQADAKSKRMEETEALRKKIAAAERNAAQLAQLLDDPWPREALTRTKLVRASIQTTRSNRVILVRDGEAKDKERLRLIEKQFPGMDHAKILKGLRPGCIAEISNESRVMIEDDESGEVVPSTANTLVVGKLGVKTETNDDTEELIKLCLKIARNTSRRRCDRLMVQPPEAEDLTRLRKALECSMDGIDVLVEVCLKGTTKPPSAEKSGAKPQGPKTPKPKPTAERPEVGVVMVKPGGELNFAEALKSLKANVRVGEDGVELEKVSITGSGDIRIQVRETKEGGRKAFAESLAKKAEALHMEVKSVAALVPVAIRGIDATVDKGELEEALSKAGVPEADLGDKLSLGEPQAGRIGTRTAIVRLKPTHASKLMALGVLQVGWSGCRCRITRFEQPQCCFNCQKFGHLARNCTESKVEGRKCYRCGRDDHIAKECNSAPKCYVCGAEGHRADSRECPAQKTSNSAGKPPGAPAAPTNKKKPRRRKGNKDKEVAAFEEEEEMMVIEGEAAAAEKQVPATADQKRNEDGTRTAAVEKEVPAARQETSGGPSQGGVPIQGNTDESCATGKQSSNIDDDQLAPMQH